MARRQAIIETCAVILLIGRLQANFSEILIRIQNLSFMKMLQQTSFAKRQPFVWGWISQLGTACTRHHKSAYFTGQRNTRKNTKGSICIVAEIFVYRYTCQCAQVHIHICRFIGINSCGFISVFFMIIPQNI